MCSGDSGDRAERFRRERHVARQCVLQFLYQADQQHDWGNIERNLSYLKGQVRELHESLEGVNFSHAWRFACELVRGICGNRAALDELIGNAATNWTVPRMSVIDRNILRLSTYELCFSDGIPPFTAIDEGVELAKEFGHSDSSRFVNGVLDRILHLRQTENGAGEGVAAPGGTDD